MKPEDALPTPAIVPTTTPEPAQPARVREHLAECGFCGSTSTVADSELVRLGDRARELRRAADDYEELELRLDKITKERDRLQAELNAEIKRRGDSAKRTLLGFGFTNKGE